jgi:hypothetical protein
MVSGALAMAAPSIQPSPAFYPLPLAQQRVYCPIYQAKKRIRARFNWALAAAVMTFKARS